MARAPRTQAPGEAYHVTARGVRRSALFVDEHDYELYIALLGRTAEHVGWHVLAYCLMPNHVHLVVQLTEPTLSAGMHRLHGVFARELNRRWGHSGHAFDARFAAAHLDSEQHLLSAIRYVAQNPVRAGLCTTPDEWPWSSHRAIAGLPAAAAPVAVDRTRDLFGAGASATRRYRRFVAAA